MARLIMILLVLFGMATAPVSGRAARARGSVHGALEGRLQRLLGGISSKPDYVAISALRQLWAQWEQVDPSQVEAALVALAADRALSPAVRAYAGVLEAYARRRRGDLRGARRRFGALGFVHDWLLIGPFDNDNRGGLQTATVIEDELAQPVVFDRAVVGKERAVRWRRVADVNRYGLIDVGALLRPVADICAYVTTYVRIDKPRDLALWIGTGGAYKLYFNDEMVLEDGGYRSLDVDRRGVVVRPIPGFNRITAKICADESPALLSLRVAEPDGTPAPDLEFSTTLQASTEAATGLRRLRRVDGAREVQTKAKRRKLGPLTALEAALKKAGKKASPKLLEAFARYLVETRGEAEGEHLARDLAGRAAEAKPTVARLLLAAQLAEDKNGRRVLVQAAARLAKGDEERIAVSLAQASLLRHGPNPREALGVYEEVLRRDPRSVAAIVGKVELFVAVGLQRTALELLQRSVAVQPSAIGLLRPLAGQLRALGRDSEAAEVEHRYAALRFDDAGYLQQRLQQAAARNDSASARRWSKRLLESEPSSGWAFAAAARAHLRLGERARAEASYRRALELAPEDVATMQALADFYGLAGERAKQHELLRSIVRIKPQATAVRAYLDHIAPSGERRDEGYAWPPEKFLAKRSELDARYPLHTMRKLSVTTMYESGLASHFHQVVLAPLTDEAAASVRQYAFSYHADRQVVQLQAAKIYRRDGRVDEAIESGEVPVSDRALNMYSLQRTFYIQFPRVEPGDLVELRYRVEDVAVRSEYGGHFGEVDFLQAASPIGDMEYVFIAPESRAVNISIGPQTSKEAARFSEQVTLVGKKRIHRYHAKNVAPLKVEPRMPRASELLVHAHVSTFPSWQMVGRWYWGLAKEKLDVDDDVRQLAQRLVKGKTTELEKVAAIYHYAAGETQYVALEFGIEGIRPRRAALTLARGWGDCKDKATLIVSLLRQVGITAELVLVRTALRGRMDPTTASLAPFDHAIAYVPSLDLYLDGTAAGTGTAELPAADRGAMALRITPQGGKLVTLPNPDPSQSLDKREMRLTLGPDARVAFRGRFSNVGVDAPSWRARYQADAGRRERVQADLQASLGTVQLRRGKTGVTVRNLANLERPVELEVSGHAPGRKEGQSISVPMGPSWSLVRRLAPRTSRRLPVLLGAQRSHEERWSLALPPGAKVLSQPAESHLVSPFGTFDLEVVREGSVLTVTTRFRLSGSRVGAAQYAAFRAFCEEIDRRTSARVLVRLKTAL